MYHDNQRAQSYKIFDNKLNKSQKLTPNPFYVLFLYKNHSFSPVIHIFYQIINDLVKKNETMLIVYKNKLNHFEVCIRNSNFAP